VEGWEQQVRKYARTLTVRHASITAFDLDYRAIDRVGLKGSDAHILINPITISY